MLENLIIPIHVLPLSQLPVPNDTIPTTTVCPFIVANKGDPLSPKTMKIFK